MKTTWKFVCKALAIAQKSELKQMDKDWKNIRYSIKDKIWLSTQNITTNQPSTEFNHKMLGFFEVIRNKKVLVKL